MIGDYNTAKAFLDERGGRWANYAVIARNTHLVRESRESAEINVQLHGHAIVTFHLDGTQTLRTYGWATNTTKDRINGFSAASVFSNRGSWFIGHKSDPISPAKVQKCRTCHGTGFSWAWCYVRMSYGGPRRERVCEHPLIAKTPEGQVLEVFQRQSWEPGKAHRYQTDRKCWGCAGTGRRNYGSKVQATPWNGQPIRVDATGKVLGYENREGFWF